VEDLIPSVIVRAKDQGKDLLDARVIVDEKLMTTKLDGHEIPLDPGPHRFRVEHGSSKEQQDVLIVSGEQGRPLLFTFGKAVPSPTSQGFKPAAPPVESRPVPASVYATASLTIAALGVGTAFALIGKGNENDLLQTCAPSCAKTQFDDLQTKYTIADIGFGVAAASAIATTILYLTRPTVLESQSSETSTATVSPRWDIAIGASQTSRQFAIRAAF
jgi:hypothetical protein